MSDDYLWDRSGPPDPDVERLEKLLAPLAHDAPLDELRLRRRRKTPWIVLGVAIAAAAAVVVFVALPRDPAGACRGGEGFAFEGEGGAIACGDARVAAGVLPVGGSLDTGARGAKLDIADIGTARLGTHTKVRLDRTDAKRHQLHLERGSLHAKVLAPPRLFAVTTTHTDVIDLGCEYEIIVDANGAGSIEVLTGIVELATKSGTIVVAPEQTSAALLAGQRPGLVVGRNARTEIKDAVRAFDAGDPAAAARLLALAKDRDAITVIALYAAVDDAQRLGVLSRLYEISPPPDVEITPETALEDPAKLAAWSQDIVEVYRGVWAYKP
jgi:ferric-dicitrate binding protein FerR (iron transport regulator)